MIKILFGLFLGLILAWFVIPVPDFVKIRMATLVEKYPAIAPFVRIE